VSSVSLWHLGVGGSTGYYSECRRCAHISGYQFKSGLVAASSRLHPETNAPHIPVQWVFIKIWLVKFHPESPEKKTERESTWLLLRSDEWETTGNGSDIEVEVCLLITLYLRISVLVVRIDLVVDVD